MAVSKKKIFLYTLSFVVVFVITMIIILYLFVGIFICLMLVVEARASLLVQLPAFFVFILGGSIGLMITLRRAGILKALRGDTSLQEVLRVTMAD